VVLYIIRRTFGFKRQTDTIAISQLLHGITKKNGEVLDKGTGLSKPTLLQAIRSLTEKNIIIPARQFDERGGFMATEYRLNIASNPPVSQHETPPSKKILPSPPLGKEIGQALVKKSYIQGTVIQDTDTNVNVNKERGGETGREEPKTDLHRLPNLGEPTEKTDYIASEILAVLGDANSKPFYRLVAAKIPESFIRQKLSELKQGNAHSPEKVFASIVKNYAAEKLAEQKMQSLYSRYNAIGKLPFSQHAAF
jgi:hypothetical protein